MSITSKTQSILEDHVITLDQLKAFIKEDSTYGVYVLNSATGTKTDILISKNASGESEITQKVDPVGIPGDLHIKIDSALDAEMLFIPSTKLPVPFDLTAQADAEMILKSRYFKTCVEKEDIFLLDKEGYEKLMSVSSIKDAKANARTKNGRINVKGGISKLLNKLEPNRLDNPIQPLALQEIADLTPVVYRFLTEEGDKNELYRDYKTIESDLTKKDLQYLATTSPLKRIQESASKKLSMI